MSACSCCAHDRRSEIDQALMSGTPIRSVAETFGLSRAAVGRHKQQHLTPRDPEVDKPKGRPPARGYSWPPFEPGNTAALTHGAKSARAVEPIAQQYLAAIAQDSGVPYLREARYAPALAAWAQAEARLVLVEQWVAKMELDEAATAPAGRTPPLEMLRKMDESAARHRDRLGPTPMAAARLGRDVAAARATDVAVVMAEMHRQDELLAGEVG